jgi:K+-transporting ATPase ATPase C chain
MVTASGAGLDPHIPPGAAALQAARVARTRSLDVNSVRELIAAHTESPVLGVFGRARVNVLELNLALDERFGGMPSVDGTTATNGR